MILIEYKFILAVAKLFSGFSAGSLMTSKFGWESLLQKGGILWKDRIVFEIKSIIQCRIKGSSISSEFQKL